MQTVWVGEQKNKADFKIKEKIRWKNDLIYSCRKKHTEKKWYDEIGQSVFSFKMHNSLREAEKQSELERSSWRRSNASLKSAQSSLFKSGASNLIKVIEKNVKITELMI